MIHVFLHRGDVVLVSARGHFVDVMGVVAKEKILLLTVTCL